MKFKVFRDWLQQMIYKIINPIVHGMIKIGITPNFITTMIQACECRDVGEYRNDQQRNDEYHDRFEYLVVFHHGCKDTAAESP